MITTNTGAKKIEGTDNWREIFDAHNDSVDAQDKLAPDMAPIVNGNKCVSGASAGDYVLVRNSSITGITDGAYIAAQAIPANTAIDSTYLTAISGGALNSLNSKFFVYDTGEINLNNLSWSGDGLKYATAVDYSVLGGTPVSALIYSFSKIKNTDVLTLGTNNSGHFRIMSNVSSFTTNAYIKCYVLCMKA